MSTTTNDTAQYPISKRNRVVRRHERGRYDHATVHAILDAALVGHIAYTIDGQPYCTPTAFWRDGSTLYWHGSSASRMIRAQSDGLPVCLTVTHLDALILARSAFHHSVNYRSAMVFGSAELVTDPIVKRRAVDGFIDRFYPGRSASLRPPTDQELKATAFVAMAIQQASAKLRDMHVVDDEDDYALPIWAGRVRLQTLIAAVEDCPRQRPDIPMPPDLAAYTTGNDLETALRHAAAVQAGMQPV